MILAASPWWNAVPAWGAAIGYALLAISPHRLGKTAVAILMTLVWLLHGLALLAGLSWVPVHFGFGPALSFTAWLVLTVYAIESRLYPQLRTRWTLAALGAAAVLLAWYFPGTHYPSLGSGWLPLHWALGIASYGLLGAAVVHAWMMQRVEQSIRRAQPGSAPLPLLALERLTFRFVLASFVTLTATLLAGWWFTELLHPAVGLLTHKTIFSALSWVVLAVLLWGRWQWGWRGRLAVRMLYAAAVFLLLGYVGSRFVLEVILHRA